MWLSYPYSERFLINLCIFIKSIYSDCNASNISSDYFMKCANANSTEISYRYE